MQTDYLHDLLVEWRHDFHRHPELGFEEQRTSDRIARILEKSGLEVNRGVSTLR